ncbi:unnamed protein product [Cochlearia groenlandica]
MNLKAMQEINARKQQEDGSKVAVETTEQRSSAGKGLEQKKVEIVHQSHPKTSGGVLVGAAAAVESTLESAKEVISNSKS